MVRAVAGQPCRPAAHRRSSGGPAGRTLIASLILAGGAARRLGGTDKPLLAIGGLSMLARILAVLEPPVAISANGDPARFPAAGPPILDDGAFLGLGPLAGVLTGLDWAASIGATALLTVPGDMPFIPRGLAAALEPPPSCVAAGERVHHLLALWPVGLRGGLRDHLSRPGPRHVVRFTEAIGMRRVDFPRGTWDSFLNVNTARDLDTARAKARETEGPG